MKVVFLKQHTESKNARVSTENAINEELLLSCLIN